jgi:hypothetical protein
MSMPFSAIRSLIPNRRSSMPSSPARPGRTWCYTAPGAFGWLPRRGARLPGGRRARRQCHRAVQGTGPCPGDPAQRRAEAAGRGEHPDFENGAWTGDNTDGAGLVRDLTGNLARSEWRAHPAAGRGRRRARRHPALLEQGPECLFIANRTADKAVALARNFAAMASKHRLPGGGYRRAGRAAFDVVLNATAASLAGDLPPLPDDVFAPGAWPTT